MPNFKAKRKPTQTENTGIRLSKKLKQQSTLKAESIGKVFSEYVRDLIVDDLANDVGPLNK